mmetsp:Transcript_18762/g.72359  ORF Transcript_18762/g.72359 Transcript_18762/m.72359 type:complete len:240 (+) Transcript_18762:1262-1981(+)
MQMMGVRVVLISLISSAMPPLSEPDMPSTSSMMSTLFFFVSAAPAAGRLAANMDVIVRLPSSDAMCRSIAFLLRVSLALNSTVSKPISFDTNSAAEVLPMPGSPEMRRARLSLGPTLPAFHLARKARTCLMAPGLPTRSPPVAGLYLSVHSCDSPPLPGGPPCPAAAAAGFATVTLAGAFFFASAFFCFSVNCCAGDVRMSSNRLSSLRMVMCLDFSAIALRASIFFILPGPGASPTTA